MDKITLGKFIVHISRGAVKAQILNASPAERAAQLAQIGDAALQTIRAARLPCACEAGFWQNHCLCCGRARA